MLAVVMLRLQFPCLNISLHIPGACWPQWATLIFERASVPRPIILACTLLAFLQAPAQAQSQRLLQQEELEALVTPVAFHPDPLPSSILRAARFPREVADAAQWLSVNPAPGIDEAARYAQDMPWDAGVKALLPFPAIVGWMAQNPQWMIEVGYAFVVQAPQIMQAVQTVRLRAHGPASLSANGQQVLQYGQTIAVQPVFATQPVFPGVVYVSPYNSFLVYGAWRPVHRVILWRPANFPARHQDLTVMPYVPIPEAFRQPIIQSAPRLAWPPATTPLPRR